MTSRRSASGIAAIALALALGGCGTTHSQEAPRINAATGAGTPAPGGPATPAPPSPVDTSATISGNCVMGYESPTIGSNGYPQSDYSNFQAGPPKGSTIDGNYWAPAIAYQLTLTNDSGSTADVTGFAVVFYDASGAEAGSDQQAGTGFITPGQSLTWTELASLAVDGSGDGGSDPNIPASAATCQLVQWYQP
jgi:hypothetical protein